MVAMTVVMMMLVFMVMVVMFVFMLMIVIVVLMLMVVVMMVMVVIVVTVRMCVAILRNILLRHVLAFLRFSFQMRRTIQVRTCRSYEQDVRQGLDFRKGIDATNFVNHFRVNCFIY